MDGLEKLFDRIFLVLQKNSLAEDDFNRYGQEVMQQFKYSVSFHAPGYEYLKGRKMTDGNILKSTKGVSEFHLISLDRIIQKLPDRF